MVGKSNDEIRDAIWIYGAIRAEMRLRRCYAILHATRCASHIAAAMLPLCRQPPRHAGDVIRRRCFAGEEAAAARRREQAEEAGERCVARATARRRARFLARYVTPREARRYGEEECGAVRVDV